MYKSQLQEYVQKAALPPPAYESVKEGAAHQPRFRAAVTVDGVRFESDSGHTTLKAAEHAAAKIALAELMKSGSGKNGVTPALVHESGLCKNLLQEYAQKSGLVLPVYRTIRSGDDHAPTFTSTVDIGGARYSGDTARSKKDAEVKAARTALLAIHKQAAAYAVAECNVGEQPGAAYLDQSGDAKKRFRQPCDTSEEEARVKRTPTSRSLAVALANLSSLKGKVQSDLCADTRKDEGPLADDTRLSLGGLETVPRNQEAPHEPSSQDSCLTQEIRASNLQQKIFSLPLDAVPMSMLSQVPLHAQQPCQLQSVVQLEQDGSTMISGSLRFPVYLSPREMQFLGMAVPQHLAQNFRGFTCLDVQNTGQQVQARVEDIGISSEREIQAELRDANATAPSSVPVSSL